MNMSAMFVLLYKPIDFIGNFVYAVFASPVRIKWRDQQ
jgi:hypothetical protein